MKKGSDLNTVINSFQYYEQASTTLAVDRVNSILQEIRSGLASATQNAERLAAVKRSIFELRKELEAISNSWTKDPKFSYAQLNEIQLQLRQIDLDALTEFSDLEYWHETESLLSRLISDIEDTISAEVCSKINRLVSLVDVLALYRPFVPITSALNQLRPAWLWNVNGEILRFLKTSKSRLSSADEISGAEAARARSEAVNYFAYGGAGLILRYGCLAVVVAPIILFALVTAVILLISSLSEDVAMTFMNFFTERGGMPVLWVLAASSPFIASGLFRSKKLDELSAAFQKHGYDETITELLEISRFQDFRYEAKVLADKIRQHSISGPVPKSLKRPSTEDIVELESFFKKTDSEIVELKGELDL